MNKLPASLTFLEVSQYKSISIPNLPHLKVLRLNDCQTFRHLVIPESVEELAIHNCLQLKVLANIKDLKLVKLDFDDLPQLTPFEFPTTLHDATLDHLELFNFDLSKVNGLSSLTIFGGDNLKEVLLPKNIINISIDCCSDLEELEIGNVDEAKVMNCS